MTFGQNTAVLESLCSWYLLTRQYLALRRRPMSVCWTTLRQWWATMWRYSAARCSEPASHCMSFIWTTPPHDLHGWLPTCATCRRHQASSTPTRDTTPTRSVAVIFLLRIWHHDQFPLLSFPPFISHFNLPSFFLSFLTLLALPFYSSIIFPFLSLPFSHFSFPLLPSFFPTHIPHVFCIPVSFSFSPSSFFLFFLSFIALSYFSSVFIARRYAKRSICRRRVSVCVCVSVCLSHSGGIVSKRRNIGSRK